MDGSGYAERFLTADETREIVRTGLASLSLAGKRVLFIIPDGTRTMPMPLFFGLFREMLGGKAAALDFLVALGTHRPMSDAELSRLVGVPVVDGRAGDSRIYNHEWADPATFATIGEISAAEIRELSGGRLAQPVTVALNRRIFDYDQIIICGPVFPHEVVGFSGGNKYFFPGIAGPDVINFTHWLGALITNYEIIGSGYTPVRAVIDRAASMVSVPTACFALVVTPAGMAGLYFGSAHEAWERASALSAKRHIVWLDKPVRQVLSVMPAMYADIWTAGKGMYKIEPVVADGGEVIIYAPHINEVSFTHGRMIEEVGYHCRDYFVAQPERFAALRGWRARALDAREGTGRLRRRDGHRDPARDGDACHRHLGRTLPAHQSRLSRSGVDRCRRLERPRARGHSRRAARRRDAVPPEALTRVRTAS